MRPDLVGRHPRGPCLAAEGVLAHVYLMSKMQARYEGGSRNIQRDLRAAGFSATLVKNNVNRLRRLVARPS